MYDSKNAGLSLEVAELSYSKFSAANIQEKIESYESGDPNITLENLSVKSLIPGASGEVSEYTVVGASDVGGIQAVAVKDSDGNITIGYRV